MGQIANRMAVELLFRLKNKLKPKKETKNPQKAQNPKGSK